MSRGCYKAYGRKVNGPSGHTSIQFGNLFCENSNKPSASKSAGTVGKWGITSFTSIRSSNFTVGKRPRDKPKEAFGTNISVNDQLSVSPSLPRPKKFFKSRAVEESPPPPPPAAKQYTKSSNKPRVLREPRKSVERKEEDGSEKTSPPPLRRTLRQASIAAAQKIIKTVDGEMEDDDDLYQTEAMNLSSEIVPASNPSPPPVPPVVKTETSPSQHPPIVLRIFKGTAQLLSEDEVVPAKKEGRRRSHGSDSGDSVSPRWHRSRSKDIEPVKKENIAPLDAIKQEVEEEVNNDEMNKCLEEANTLLANTEIDFNSKLNKLSEVKPAVTEEDREKLIRVLEDDSTETPSPEIKQDQEDETFESKVDIKAEWVAECYASTDKNQTNSEIKVEPIVLRRPQVTSRPTKKGSIFKSRAASGEKRNAPRYIHNWSDQKDEGAKINDANGNSKNTRLEGEFDSEILTRVTNYPSGEKENEESESITSVTCSKKAKEFYTVVRNVKKAHQIQESGEFQEFNDDVEYILDALQDNNPISTRCLSAITLASKCMVPAFRMHVRAHGTVTKFFRALHDSTKDQRLGMCTATVMFVLSQDRLNMDVDRDSLELMLSLLESDASHSSALEGCGLSDAELAKTKDRVRSLCQEIQEKGHAKHLNLDNITVGQLAMETLLSLTSRRAGEWFKEELRELGGLEHIIKTVVETCRVIDNSVTEWTTQLLERMRKVDRCLKVLENVAFQNEENNMYLLTYGDGILVETVVRVYHVCDQQLPYFPTTSLKDKESVGAIIRECLIANLKVLINLTHDFNQKSFGSSLATQKGRIIEATLHVLLHISQYVPDEQKFDFKVLALSLLINLVEHSENNRKLLIEAKAPPDPDAMFSAEETAVSAVVKLFLEHEELARTVEQKTDADLAGKTQDEKAAQKSHEEHMEETIALLLQRAGRHMEHTLIGAYVALLLGYLTINNQSFELYLRSLLPENNYAVMLSILQKFYNFMTLTASTGSVSSRGIKATEMLIKQLTELDNVIKVEPT